MCISGPVSAGGKRYTVRLAVRETYLLEGSSCSPEDVVMWWSFSSTYYFSSSFSEPLSTGWELLQQVLVLLLVCKTRSRRGWVL